MNLKRGVSITLGANIVFAFSQWVIIAGLNHLGSVEDVGRYAYSITLAGFFLTVGQMGLRQYLLSHSACSNHLEQAMSARVLTSFLAWFVLVIYASVSVDHSYFYLVLLLGLAKFVENISDIAHGLYQRNLKIAEIAYSRYGRSFWTPLVFLGIFYLTASITWACIGLIVCWGVLFAKYDRPALLVQKQAPLNKTPLLEMLKRSTPLGITNVLVLLAVSLPLFLLAEFVTDVELGQYASVFYFVTAASLILQSVLQVVSPVLVTHLSKGEQVAAKRLVVYSYLLAGSYGVFGVAAAMLIGEWVVAFIYGDQFVGLGYLTVLAATINFALSIQAVGGIVLTAHGVFNYQMYVMVLSVIVSAVGGYLLIASYGLAGAFYAGALTALVNALLFGIRVALEIQHNEKNTCLTHHQ
ncbi:hypothetical protein GCM10011369_21330 [Neiella marina]|uniref:Membrane protein involved in the export of O-antigen and teichoic acid n=1 Tax=Neiella marina TaxID=508461 RepID=A0A8J2XP83_9GAMM|nr:oligosaccharide flippase family protein [Neiella marina]GGA79127.1 hypothetical protein GCM10011369_21330 [Neiella marina]